MSLKAIPASLLCVLALSPMACAQGRGRGNKSAAAQNGWVFNLTEGKKQATANGKPLMVVFRCEP